MDVSIQKNLLKAEQEKKVVLKMSAVAVVVIGFLVSVGSALVMNGMILGVLMTTGAYILLLKMPLRLKKIMVNHDLISDAGFSIGAFFLFGGTTVTGMMAAAVTGLLVSIILKFEKYSLIKEGKL